MGDGVDVAMSDLHDRASECFRGFMSRVAKFEELNEVGSRFLRGFQQELAYFRRPPLDKSSKVVQRIMEANKTGRMTAYLEAGCRLTHSSLQNTEKLFSCQQGLQVHIEKVKVLVDELEGSSENAIGILRVATENPEPQLNTSISDALEKLKISADQDATCTNIHKAYLLIHPKDVFMPEEEILDDFSFGEDIARNHLEGILLLSIMTRIIHNMLKLEYIMQEKIVRSLNLNSSSEELESYCMLWELQPYVDDKIIQQSWVLVKQM